MENNKITERSADFEERVKAGGPFKTSEFELMTQEEFEAKVTEIAEDSVKRSVACELLAKKLKLEPSDEEYEQRVAEYAESYGYEDVDAFREAFSEDIIRNAVIEENVVKYLAENCVQVEKQDDADAGSEE